MKKLQDFTKKAEAMKVQVQKLKLEVQTKEQMIGLKRKQKVEIVLNGLGGTVNEKQVEQLNKEIANLQSEVKEVDERISLFEHGAKDVLFEDVQAVKDERQKLVNQYDKEIEALEEALFKQKLEFLSAVQDLQSKRLELQSELDEVSNAIQQVEPQDRGARVKNVLFVQDNYKALGIDVAPLGIMTSELHALTIPSSIHQRPASLELFRKFGIVERNERLASDKLHELKAKKK